METHFYIPVTWIAFKALCRVCSHKWLAVGDAEMPTDCTMCPNCDGPYGDATEEPVAFYEHPSVTGVDKFLESLR